MSEQAIPSSFPERTEIAIPAFGSSPALILPISRIREAESRLHESKVVNAASYSELEYVFNEGYREARKNIVSLEYESTKASKAVEDAKALALIDHYNDFLKEKKLKDSSDMRAAFLQQRPDYTSAVDRVNMLKAVISLMEGKVKVFENVCRVMKKAMDLEIRSGIIDNNKYLR
jgi:hypothetical protein